MECNDIPLSKQEPVIFREVRLPCTEDSKKALQLLNEEFWKVDACPGHTGFPVARNAIYHRGNWRNWSICKWCRHNCEHYGPIEVFEPDDYEKTLLMDCDCSKNHARVTSMVYSPATGITWKILEPKK